MKLLHVGLSLALLSALLTAPANADEKERESKGAPDIRVQTIVIGPDGKAEVSGDSLDDLPASTRKQMESMMEDARKRFSAAKEHAEEQPNKDKGAASDLEKALRKKIDGSGLGYTERFGSITVIGPEGKMTTRSLGHSKRLDKGIIAKIIAEALGDGTLPANVRETLEQALAPIERKDTPAAATKDTPAAATKDASIAEKLDAILARLEKVEAEIGELKGR